MTGTEILNASVLDILFEHRNKLYGAYHLRKTYNHRLMLSMAFAISSVMLLLYIVQPQHGTPSALPEPDDEVLVRCIEPPVDVPPPPPALPVETPPAPPAAATPSAVVNFNTILITNDADIKDIVPMQTDLPSGMMGAVTTAGTDGNNLPPATTSGNGNNAIPPEPEAAVAAPENAAPQFPGGSAAWLQFLSRHLRPPSELQPGERKTVQVQFWVSAAGVVKDFEILQSGGSVFDREVIRVLQQMPKWKPAIKNGQAVAVTFTQPVTFVGEEE